MKKTTRMNHRFCEKLRAFGERLRGLNRMQRDIPQAQLAGNVNDQWLGQSEDLSWQQYGDGGDCWWPGR